MNWLDFVILGCALLGLFIGWRMGFLGAVFNVLGIVAGILIATHFSDDIAAWFTQQGAGNAIATVLAYLVIIVGISMAAQVARVVTKKMLSLVLLGWVDTLGSLLVGLIFGIALSAALILAAARLSSDLPPKGTAAPLVLAETKGLRGGLQKALAESSIVPAFIDVTNALPAEALGLVPGDFRIALKQVEARAR